MVTAAEISKRFRANISAKKKLFVCPDCCEYVRFVYCTDKNSFFRHENSDGTRICEIYQRKTAGNQPYSPYERAGLPLYLLRRGDYFTLNIGFYPIGQQALADAGTAGLNFSLFTQENIELTTKFINEESFSSQTTVFLQLANRSKGYRLQFNRQTIPQEINEKWNNPIEGFEDVGAFFQFHEHGGIKIKKGGSIEINVDYYLLSQDDPRRSLDDCLGEKVGEIDFTTDYWTKLVYNVYQLKINSITERNKKFCLERRALLVPSSTKLNPLWPPCNKQEQFYIYDHKDHKQTALFLLKTPGATEVEHSVLTYPRRNIRSKKLTPDRSVIAMPLENEETLITLDRPTAPFFCGIKVKAKEEKEFECQILIEDKHGQKFTPGSYLTLDSPRELIISANFIGLIQVYDGFIVKRSIELNERINLDKPKWRETIKIFHGFDLVTVLDFKKPDPKKSGLPEAHFVRELVSSSSSGGGIVPAPVWLKYMLPKLQNYPLLSAYIQRTIKKGVINHKAKYKLEKFLIKWPISQGGGGNKRESKVNF